MIERRMRFRGVLVGLSVVCAMPFAVSAGHPRVTVVQLQDETDVHDELVFEKEYLLSDNERPFDVTAPVLFWEDVLTGDGMAYFRQGPLPHARTSDRSDFHVDPQKGVRVYDSPYPCVCVPYKGGRTGRIRAATDFQRTLRAYVPGRDGVFLSNTWGDGNRDACINAAFMMREIDAGADLGVDVIQIDDGWQKGRSANSAMLGKDERGRWDSWWSVKDFWEVDHDRFPQGLEPVVAYARSKGLRFGLWFGPDSSDEAASWSRDADFVLSMHHGLGVDYFKFDALRTLTPLALERQAKMMDRLLDESAGKITVDLDVTAGVRPGYYGMPRVGPVFVENRYIRCGESRLWWPHRTLRNFWSLSHVVDPARLRMEVLNPLRKPEIYPANDPLAPARWPIDAIFALSMYSSPLGWFEIQNLSPETVAAWKPLVRRWKQERDAIHLGYIYPVGQRPDGVSWTGFVSVSKDGTGGTALLFRELSEQESYALDLADFFSSQHPLAERIGGRGCANVTNGVLTVQIKDKLDFIWVKLMCESR